MWDVYQYRQQGWDVTFYQLYRKNRSRLCRIEAFYVRILGQWYLVLHLFLTRCWIEKMVVGMWQFGINAGEYAYAKEMPKDLQRFFRVHVKADFIEPNSSYKEELRAFIFPPIVSDRGSPLPPSPHKTTYHPSFCSEERLTLEMSDFLSYGDNLTFWNLLNTEFSRLTCPVTWHQSFSPK